ncbi:hypothetical protein Ssi02_29930 [Sinosporangium siamense]|uniref:Uncharacterized protein n=1 Tax=Sinosporangium siamense TaxID=1367973 RepID=A0A919V832_9ACTN|nr:hypothetical protein Ssi02_29930 [Sinosporangium siamense]
MLLFFAVAGAALLVWVATAVLGGGTDAGNEVAGIASAVFASVALFLQVQNSLSPPRPNVTETQSQLDSAARVLALRVQGVSRQEERHWRIGDPYPLRVSWHAAAGDVIDRWENIRAGDGSPLPWPRTFPTSAASTGAFRRAAWSSWAGPGRGRACSPTG